MYDSINDLDTADTDSGIFDEDNLNLEIIPSVGEADTDFGFYDITIDDDVQNNTASTVSLLPNGRGYAELSVRVTNGNGNPAPGVRVNFNVDAIRPLSFWRDVNRLAPKFRSSAQKLRSRVAAGQIKLIGTLNQHSVVTGSNGIATVTYTVSHIAGNDSQKGHERVTAVLRGGSVTWDIRIGYDDLVNLPSVGGGLRVVGATGRHIHSQLRDWLNGLGSAIKDARWPHPATITAGTLRWGGLYPPHFTHMRGASIDFRPMSTDGGPTSCEQNGSHRPNYDRQRTIQLIQVFKAAGATKIFFNDPQARSAGATPLKGHNNHIHVSWLNAAQLFANTSAFEALTPDGKNPSPRPSCPANAPSPAPRPSGSGFKIDVDIKGGLSASQQEAFADAAKRWSEVIVGDLPSGTVGGVEIDDVLIEASGIQIDGPGSILGRAGPTHVRTFGGLPLKGIMEFDTADLDEMEANGSLKDVILHEMGHVLGIGTLWTRMGLLNDAGSMNPTFTGARAMREYGTLINAAPTPVPVANTGGAGTRDGHWREHTFGDELMTGFLTGLQRPLSRMTIACLEDMGYTVNYDAADLYDLPSIQELAALGVFGDIPECQMCRVERPIPIEVAV